MPRFTFEKFPGAEPLLTTSMKSVGEAMAIGRTFAESVQKALRSMETGPHRLQRDRDPGRARRRQERDPRRAGAADARPAAGHRPGLSPRPHHRRDPRRLQIRSLVPRGDRARSSRPRRRSAARTGLPRRTRARPAARSSAWAFPTRGSPSSPRSRRAEVARWRERLGVHPVYKRIDTCAAEFPSLTPYMYSTYEGDGVSRPNARPTRPRATRS